MQGKFIQLNMMTDTQRHHDGSSSESQQEKSEKNILNSEYLAIMIVHSFQHGNMQSALRG